MKNKILNNIKKYWREIIILIMFFVLLGNINVAKKNSQMAVDYASEAYDAASEAADYAEEASAYASEAVDNTSSLYLYY